MDRRLLVFTPDARHFHTSSVMDRLLVLFSLFVLSTSGCATMANVEGKEYLFFAPGGVRKPQIYGGVIRHVEWGEFHF